MAMDALLQKLAIGLIVLLIAFSFFTSVVPKLQESLEKAVDVKQVVAVKRR